MFSSPVHSATPANLKLSFQLVENQAEQVHFLPLVVCPQDKSCPAWPAPTSPLRPRVSCAHRFSTTSESDALSKEGKNDHRRHITHILWTTCTYFYLVFINHLYPFETQKTLRIKEYIHLGFSSTRDPGGHLRGLWVCRGQQRRRSGAALSRDRHREQRRGRAGAGPGAFVNHTRA